MIDITQVQLLDQSNQKNVWQIMIMFFYFFFYFRRRTAG